MAISTDPDILGDFAEMGYSLRTEDGDETVSLYFKDGFITRFNQTKATKSDIREACQEHWNRLISQQAY